MMIQCPKCGVPTRLARVGEGGFVRCTGCGMRWDPRDSEPEPGLAVQPFAADGVPEPGHHVSDAVVIEHIGRGFTRVPPHRRSLDDENGEAPKDRRLLKAAGLVFGALVLMAAVGASLISAVPGIASIRGLPDSADLLAFQNVKSQTIHSNGVSTLYVEGEIVNRSSVDVDLPAIRVTLRSPDGAAVTSWLVEPATPGVAAGGSVGFRSALVSPPLGATQVTLDLVVREQQIVGMR